MTKNPIIKVINIQKNIKKKNILNNISFEVDEGDMVGIVGKNASGKSMLYKAISGLITLSGGEIIIDDINITKKNVFPKDLGILIEAPGFLPQFSGYKNLKLLADIRGCIDPNRIRETMQQVGLNPDDNLKYKKYSLGMKQKLGIAQAIMEHPKILLLDEPMNNLDNESILQMRELFKSLNANGTTILLTSHNREDVELLCNKVYKIQNGLLEGVI